LQYIHADAKIGRNYYLWGFNILCLLFRGETAIIIVCGEISYGKHKKLSHPFLGVGFSATVININPKMADRFVTFVTFFVPFVKK
jgi:hypothetical protein